MPIDAMADPVSDPAGGPAASRAIHFGGDAIWLASFWLIVTAYNLFKPFHIDDGAHLLIAQWIAAHPMHPMSGVPVFTDFDEPIFTLNQPPLYFYLLALWGSLFGYGEVSLHLMQAPFSLAAILLFHRIARCVVPANALWLTGMFALGPAVYVEQNIMVDVPLVAVWLWFFHALIVGRGKARANAPRFIYAALACSVALLIKYSSLMLLPVLFLTLLYQRRWRAFAVVLIPIGAVLAWSLFNYLDYGHIHMAQRPQHAFRGGWFMPLIRCVGLLATLGGITPFGVIVAARLCRMSRTRSAALYLVVAALGMVLAIAVASGAVSDTGADTALSTAFLANAALMLLAALIALMRWPGWRDPLAPATPSTRQLLVLLLWIGGHLAFYSLYAPFAAARHMLLVLPAILLVGAWFWPARLPRADAAFGLLFSVALSVMLGWSDWRWAEFYRYEAPVIRAGLPADATVWFVGGVGWLWYARLAGMQPLSLDRSQPAAGDYVVMRSDGDDENTPVKAKWKMTIVRVAVGYPDARDLFCTDHPSRFYAVPFSEFTHGPWLLTRDCRHTLDIYRLTQ
jgi:4-amino-4-deoxy-L-arabinose transferase-like glycosyltransferase